MTAENRSRDGGNVWMIVLIALALIATVIMLFSDSAVWLQIALLAALWAAICGFLLVTRTRNDRDRARAELDAREREYQAEIEALRARNDADRQALEAARAGEGLPPAVDTEVLREIRAELATLRAQLEDLSGREFGYEPAALQAEARRVKEIEARASRVAPQHDPQAPQPQPQSAPQPAQPAHQLQHEQQAPQPQPQQRPQQPVQPAQPAPEPTRPQQPQPQQAQPQPAPAPEWPKQWPEQPQHGESTRWGAPNENEVTSRITPVRDADEKQAINALTKQSGQQQAPQQQQPTPQPQHEPAPHVHRGPSSDAVAGRVGSHRAPEGRNPLTDLIRERQEELDRERAERELQQRQEQEAQQRREREARERAERERREEEARRAEEARIAEQERREQERREQERWEQERREEEARRREAELEAESRGRRRADENRNGALTVAELLARSKKGR